MINLYPDQERLVNEARHQLSLGVKNILVQAATGFGKSVIAAYMVQRANAKGNRCAFIVPRKQLLEQMAKNFRNFDLSYSYVAAGEFFDPATMNYICSMQTLVRRLDDISPDIIFVDETHYGEGQLNKIIEYFKARGCIIIGLSATPWKLSGRGLGDWYDVMCEGESVRWLIDNGRLSNYRLFGVDTPDFTGIKKSNGEYSKRQMDSRMENDRVLIGNAVEHYRKHAFGNIHVTFCQSIKHSKITAQAFCDAGIPAAHMDGETPMHERRRIINALADREIMNITSVDLMTFGFDLAAQVGRDVTVESMSDLRPTQSLALQMQKWGRALRKKNRPALIFDHANNWSAHGRPCADREWSLEGREKRKKKEDDSGKDIQCTSCFHIYSAVEHKKCPLCGHAEKIAAGGGMRDPKEIEGELEEIKIQHERKQKRRQEGMCETLEDWINLADERGYNKKWAHIRHKARQKQEDNKINEQLGFI